MVQHIAGRATTWDKVEILEEHAHSESKVYPTLANGVTVTGAAGAWTLGNYAQIVPINTITTDFDIHFVTIENSSASDIFELVLYASTTEIGRIKIFALRNISGNVYIGPVPIQTPIIRKNTQIQAKVASSSGGGDNIDISIHYHVY